MKKSLIAVAALAAVAGAAQAESSVTLYGIMDAGVRYDSDATVSSGQTQMVSGIIAPSRFGIKGTEDLSGGLKANFTLESTVALKTGASGATNADTGTTLFDRRAVVGLSGAFGAVDLGRNTTFAFDLAGAGVTDPLGLMFSTITQNAAKKAIAPNPVASLIGSGLNTIRRDNMVKYVGSYGPVSAGLAYAIGGTTDSDAKSSAQAMLRYKANGADVAVSFDQLRDSASRRQKTLTVGGNYTLSGVKLSAGYLQVAADAGFKGDVLTGASATGLNEYLSGASTASSKAAVWNLGVGYNVLSNVNVTAAYYNTRFAADGVASNSYDSYVVRALYSLSKRTDLYAAVDHTHAKDLPNASVNTASGHSDNVGVTTGVIHRF